MAKFVDGVELHSKWPYSGDVKCEGLEEKSLAYWQEQFPFKITRALCDANGTEVKSSSFDPLHKDRVNELRAKAAELGLGDFLIANNEYGITPGNVFSAEYRRFHFSLILLEYLQDLVTSGFDMAALWNNLSKPGSGIYPKTKLLQTYKNGSVRLNPVHMAFELLKSVQGKKIIGLTLTDPTYSPRGYGFAVFDPSANEVQILLLNKASSESKTILNLPPGSRIESGRVESMVSDFDVLTGDDWGKAVSGPLTFVEGTAQVILPPLSYTKVTVSLRQAQ